MKSIVILISGAGTNMRALAQAGLDCRIAAVISNRPDAPGLKMAEQLGLTTRVIDHTKFVSREDFDSTLAQSINDFAPDYILLAGFMRILGDNFINKFNNLMINIHPSLLPAFGGLHTHQKALAEGVKIHGCTVHFVTAKLDHGPIIAQAAVPVLETDDEATLAARVREAEHRIYPMALKYLLEGRVLAQGGRCVIAGSGTEFPILLSPGEPQ
ncbi:MAG: phosphoribosylglycinamide formyltransferase [Burkholderiales bacterium]